MVHGQRKHHQIGKKRSYGLFLQAVLRLGKDFIVYVMHEDEHSFLS